MTRGIFKRPDLKTRFWSKVGKRRKVDSYLPEYPIIILASKAMDLHRSLVAKYQKK
jgi:hypothetical protein